MATDHDDPDFEPAHDVIPDRSRPHRAAALWPPSLPGRARSAAAARRRDHRRRRRRHLRRPRRDAQRHPARARSRGPALVDRQPVPPRVDRIERELDDNEQAQQRSQREQNGSEVRSVELERLIAEGMTLIERRNTMELFRDQAAEHFEMPHRLGLAAALRVDGQSSHADRGR